MKIASIDIFYRVCMQKVKRACFLFSVLAISIVFVIPYLWMIVSAFKARENIFADLSPISYKLFIPYRPTLSNFLKLLEETIFPLALVNSLGIAVITIIFSLVLCSMISFAISRLEFPGRNVLFVLIISTMLIPFEMVMVPMFLLVQKLKLDDTYPSIFLPWISDPFIIFLLRQHFLEIPQALQDAAIIDGCSYTNIFFRIMLPNIKPALISAALIKFIFSWDAYVWPLVVIRDKTKTVITVAIAKLFTDQDILWELIFAGAFLATIPILVLFFFLQRYYVEGIVTTGIK
ncbi:MAG: carbohydrate ABC transporter permease [Spirochaetota bacterium]